MRKITIENYRLLGCSVVRFSSSPIFRRYILPPASSSACLLLLLGFLFGLFFDPEDGFSMPLRNVGELLLNRKTLLSRRQQFSIVIFLPFLRSAYHLLSRWLLSWFVLRPWKLRRYVRLKRRLAFNGLHSVVSHRCENLNSYTVIEAPEPTYCNSPFPWRQF
jgi:hypothetical protein